MVSPRAGWWSAMWRELGIAVVGMLLVVGCFIVGADSQGRQKVVEAGQSEKPLDPFDLLQCGSDAVEVGQAGYGGDGVKESRTPEEIAEDVADHEIRDDFPQATRRVVYRSGKQLQFAFATRSGRVIAVLDLEKNPQEGWRVSTVTACAS